MALTFPLNLETFSKALYVESITFDLSEGVEQKTLGSGEIMTAQHGVRLWFGTVTLARMRWAELEDDMALIRALQRPGATFLAYPMHLERSTANNGTLNAVQNSIEARFGGMGAGTVIPRGSFFSFTYGGKTAFHQTAQTATADGTGLTGYVEVVPPIRTGHTLSAAVTFATPSLKAVLVPGSVRPATIRSVLAEGVSFDWRQTLR